MPKDIYNVPVAKDFMRQLVALTTILHFLADLIDNASPPTPNIIIEASFQKNEIRISDDGCGMNEEALLRAMGLVAEIQMKQEMKTTANLV